MAKVEAEEKVKLEDQKKKLQEAADEQVKKAKAQASLNANEAIKKA